MKIRVVWLALTFASTGLAQPQDEPEQPAPEQEDAIDARAPAEEIAPDDEQIVIETLQGEVDMLRDELARAMDEIERKEAVVNRLTEQLNEDELAPQRVPGVYSQAVGNAISDLADCEQRLISGDDDGVDERLGRAQAVLSGPSAAYVEEARIALARGDKGNARASLSAAIAAANDLY